MHAPTEEKPVQDQVLCDELLLAAVGLLSLALETVSTPRDQPAPTEDAP